MKPQPKLVYLISPKQNEKVPLLRPHDPLRALATFLFGVALGMLLGYLLSRYASDPLPRVAKYFAVCILDVLCCGGYIYWLWLRQDRNVRRLVAELEEREEKKQEVRP